MPIINDPPKRTTRAARHAQQVEHKATGGVTTEAGKASEATKPVAGMADVGSVVSAQALSELDALWGKKQLDNVAQRIAQLVAPWQGFDFTGLDPAALDQLAGRLFVLEQRLTALINRMSMVDGPEKLLLLLAVPAHAQPPSSLIPESGILGTCNFITGSIHFDCLPCTSATSLNSFWALQEASLCLE